MASPSIFRSVARPRSLKGSHFLSRSLTFATGDRLINRVAATPWPSPLHVKDDLHTFFHIKDHSVRTSIILAFCCVRAPVGVDGWALSPTRLIWQSCSVLPRYSVLSFVQAASPGRGAGELKPMC